MTTLTRRDILENAVHERMIDASAQKPGAWPSVHNMRILAECAVDEMLDRVALAERLTASADDQVAATFAAMSDDGGA